MKKVILLTSILLINCTTDKDTIIVWNAKDIIAMYFFGFLMLCVFAFMIWASVFNWFQKRKKK